MKRVVLASLFLTLVGLSTAPAYAQDRPIGLVMSMPTDVGIIWHVNEKIAVRPEINFSFGSSETEVDGTQVNESSGTGLGLEASLLYFLDDADSVRTYVSPRVGYSWSSEEDDDSSEDASLDVLELSASFGAMYSPVPRFSVFGEIGLEYARGSSSFDTAGGNLESRSNSWGPRSEVGVILYLGR